MKKFLTLYLVGYIIAVFVAVAVTEFILLAPTTLPDHGRYGSFYRQVEELMTIYAIGLFYTFTTALPGYCVTLWSAIRLKRHDWWFYCFGGALTAVLAHLILSLFLSGENFRMDGLVFISMFGGAVGAYSYYLWRRKLIGKTLPDVG